jgi:hypothetical protein
VRSACCSASQCLAWKQASPWPHRPALVLGKAGEPDEFGNRHLASQWENLVFIHGRIGLVVRTFHARAAKLSARAFSRCRCTESGVRAGSSSFEARIFARVSSQPPRDAWCALLPSTEGGRRSIERSLESNTTPHDLHADGIGLTRAALTFARLRFRSAFVSLVTRTGDMADRKAPRERTFANAAGRRRDGLPWAEWPPSGRGLRLNGRERPGGTSPSPVQRLPGVRDTEVRHEAIIVPVAVRAFSTRAEMSQPSVRDHAPFRPSNADLPTSPHSTRNRRATPHIVCSSVRGCTAGAIGTATSRRWCLSMKDSSSRTTLRMESARP